MLEEGLGYRETCRKFEVSSRDQIKSWERIYNYRIKAKLKGLPPALHR